MVSFGLEVTKAKAHAKIQEIRTRLLTNDFIKNPFTSKIVIHGKDFYVITIEPIYPPVYMFAFFPFAIWFVFPGSWFGILSLIITCGMVFLGLWWWDRFYYLLFWLVTKRGVKFVSASKTLSRVV